MAAASMALVQGPVTGSPTESDADPTKRDQRPIGSQPTLVDETPDEGQLPVAMRNVHTVAHDIDVRTCERTIVGFDRHRARRLLVQQNARFDARRAARCNQILGEYERAAGIEDIVDQDDVAVQPEVEIAQDETRPLTSGFP
jgi:hypothetical protein